MKKTNDIAEYPTNKNGNAKFICRVLRAPDGHNMYHVGYIHRKNKPRKNTEKDGQTTQRSSEHTGLGERGSEESREDYKEPAEARLAQQ